MSRAQSQIDTWITDTFWTQVDWDRLTPCVRELTRDEKVHGICHDWDALESAVRPLNEYEKLVGYHIITEKQHEQTTRLVDDTGKETVERATADGHDYSDCGGDDQ